MSIKHRAPPMRAIFILLTALISDSVSAADIQQQLQALQLDAPRQRQTAPAFELTDLEGKRIRLADYRGQLVLINFWATFCKPCRDEMPAIAALARDFKQHGLVVLAVAADRGNRKGVQTFAQQFTADITVPLDPDGKVRNTYEIDALPTSYLIGRDSRFIARAIGERAWNSQSFRALLEDLLKAGTGDYNNR